jgi:endoglucanase
LDEQARTFLREILETPSPSGFERPVQERVRAYAAAVADEVHTDLHGNVIACKNPGAPLRVMLAGHCDQIGLIVSHIDKEGFLFTQTIGGWDPQQLVGQRMTVWTKDGPLAAVISRKAIHLLTDEERGQVVKTKELWLDIGAKDRADAQQAVRIGDAVTLALGYNELRNGLAASPGMDDKCGLWVVMEALRRASTHNLRCSLYAVSTVQEEIGLRGARTSAYGIDPRVGIAVDVTHATDSPGADQRQEGEIKLGSGPVIFRGPNMNPVVSDGLMATAEARDIPYQPAASGRATGTDANVLQVNRAGVAAGLVSIPNRYMHSAVETISLDDIDRAADLLAEYAADLSGDEDFTP